jgi:hypothetical protein
VQGLQSMLIHAAIVLTCYHDGRCARRLDPLRSGHRCAHFLDSTTQHNSFPSPPLPPSLISDAGKPETLPPSGWPVVGQCKLETLHEIHLLSCVSRAGVRL